MHSPFASSSSSLSTIISICGRPAASEARKSDCTLLFPDDNFSLHVSFVFIKGHHVYFCTILALQMKMTFYAGGINADRKEIIGLYRPTMFQLLT